MLRTPRDALGAWAPRRARSSLHRQRSCTTLLQEDVAESAQVHLATARLQPCSQVKSSQVIEVGKLSMPPQHSSLLLRVSIAAIRRGHRWREGDIDTSVAKLSLHADTQAEWSLHTSSSSSSIASLLLTPPPPPNRVAFLTRPPPRRQSPSSPSASALPNRVAPLTSPPPPPRQSPSSPSASAPRARSLSAR